MNWQKLATPPEVPEETIPYKMSMMCGYISYSIFLRYMDLYFDGLVTNELR